MGQWISGWVDLSGVVQRIYWFDFNANFTVVYWCGLGGYAGVSKRYLPPFVVSRGGVNI